MRVGRVSCYAAAYKYSASLVIIIRVISTSGAATEVRSGEHWLAVACRDIRGDVSGENIHCGDGLPVRCHERRSSHPNLTHSSFADRTSRSAGAGEKIPLPSGVAQSILRPELQSYRRSPASTFGFFATSPSRCTPVLRDFAVPRNRNAVGQTWMRGSHTWTSES